MRTGDLWPDSLTNAKVLKASKYQLLKKELLSLYKGWAVEVVPFVVGSRSYINEEQWTESWGTSTSLLRQ